jgi:hypothetical protein
MLLECAAVADLGLLVLAEHARGHAEPVPDVGDLPVADPGTVTRQDLAIPAIDFLPKICGGGAALVDLGLGHQTLREADRRLEAVGVRLDGDAVVTRRLLRAMQLLVDLSELGLATRAFLLVEAFGLTREHLEHGQRVVPALGADQAVCDTLPGLHVIGIELEHALEQLQCARWIGELAIDDLRRIPHELDALGAAGRRSLGTLHHLDGLLPVATLVVQRP